MLTKSYTHMLRMILLNIRFQNWETHVAKFSSIHRKIKMFGGAFFGVG